NVDEQSPTALYEHFKAMIAEAREDLIISSPYLVPDSELIELIADLVERGVRVRILTNSLASNSHVIAHSAYKKWRRALLAAGAELYEMRSDAEVLERYKTPPAEPKWLALHTKAVVVDGRTSFVGSPNVDPRSMILNTEIGVIADDPELAAALVRLLERDMAPANSWRVTLENGGWLKWWNGDERVDRQPAKGFQQRAVEFFLNLLPIKDQAERRELLELRGAVQGASRALALEVLELLLVVLPLFGVRRRLLRLGDHRPFFGELGVQLEELLLAGRNIVLGI